MAVKLAGGARRSRGGRRRATPMADINVTPMVDVMLVLLVIFMITAPLLTVGIPVDLPKTKAEAMQDPDEPLVITINKQGKIYLQETELQLDTIAPRLTAITNNNPEAKIFIRGDKGIDYGTVMGVMGELTSAGFRAVSLIVETPGDSGDSGSGNAAAPAKKKTTN